MYVFQIHRNVHEYMYSIFKNIQNKNCSIQLIKFSMS